MHATSLTNKKRSIQIAGICSLLLLLPLNASGFDKRLQTGLSVGYSGTYIDKDNSPNIFNGLALGGHLEYGINRVFAVSVDGSIDLHRPYNAWKKEEVIDDKGNQNVGWVVGPKIDKYFLSSGAVSVLYAIDLFRIVPVFALGVVASRVDKHIDGEHETTRAFGVRIGGGFEYYLRRFSVSAGVHSDRYLGGDSNLVNRLCFTITGAYIFDFGAKSLE